MRIRPNLFLVALALLMWLLLGAAYFVFAPARIVPAHAQAPDLFEIVELQDVSPRETLLGCPPKENFQNEELKVEDEPNNNRKLANELVYTETVRANIHPAKDVDWYKFDAPAGQRFSAATSTLASSNCSKDSQVDLYDAGGNLLASDDDSGAINGDVASSIAGVLLPTTGTYYLRVSGDGAATIQPYQLYTNLYDNTPVAEIEPNGSLPTAQMFPIGEAINGTVSSGADYDYYKLMLNAGDTVFLSLDMDPNRTGANWDGRVGLGVFNGIVLVGNDVNAVAPRSEAMIWTVRDTGTYYAFVDGNGAPSDGPYHLSINVFPGVNGFDCMTYLTTDIPKTIGPAPGTVQSTLTITPTNKVTDVNAKILITHELPSDLQLSLRAPNGKQVPLVWNVGSSFYKILQTEFDDEAGVTPYGIYDHITYQPQAPNRLSQFNGLNPMGEWAIVITDTLVSNGGTLFDWQLELCDGAKADKPKQVAPKNHATVSKQKTLFDWQPSDGAMTYNLEVRQDSKQGPKVVDKKNLAASQVKANLNAGHTYFWRVFACNVYGCKASKWFDLFRK